MIRPMPVAVLTALLLASPAAAQERTGPVVLRTPASPWALALGDGFTAGRGTSDILFYNPANLAMGVGVSASVQRWGSASTAASLSHVLTSSGWGIGVGLRYLDYGASGGALTHPAELMSRGPHLASSLAASVGVSRVIKGLRTGVTLKYVEERLPAERDGFGVVDLGVGRELGIFSLGLTVRDLGPDRELALQPLESPTRVSFGALLRTRPLGVFFDYAAIAEVTLRRDGRVEAAGGGELVWVPLEGWSIAGRVGFRTPEKVGDLGQQPYTAGFGVSLDRFTLDYAADPYRGGRVGHRLGIRIR